MIGFNEVYECLRHLSDEDGFERFDELYEKVVGKEETMAFEDIRKLCLLFKEKIPNMEPHQFIKIRKITYFTIDLYGIEEGFIELIKGLEEIIDYNPTETRGYLNMLMNSYKEEDIKIFSRSLRECDLDFKLKIQDIIQVMQKEQPEYYDVKGKIILQAI